MKILKKKLLANAIMVATSAMVISMASFAWAGADLNVTLNSNTMTTTVEDANSVYVRIAGPNGYTKELSGKGFAQWSPTADTPDGLYQFDSYSWVNASQNKLEKEKEEETSKQMRTRKSGSFHIENGMIVSPQQEPKQSSNAQSPLEQMLASIMNTLIPTANAADLTASSGQPRLTFNDTFYPGVEWRLEGNQINTGTTEQNKTGYFILYDYLGNNDHEVFRIDGKMGSSNNRNSFRAYENGDVNLADSVFIDKSTNRLGVGTTTPRDNLHLSGNGVIRQDGSNNEYWQLKSVGDYQLVFHKKDGSTHSIMTVENDDNFCRGTNEKSPCVGFFKASDPEASVHIKKNDGHTQLLVEEGSGTTAVRHLIKMKNNGAVGFTMEDTNLNNAWDFRTASNGSFLVSNIGVPGSKLQINKNGSVFLNGTKFMLNPAGNLTVAGTATAVAHISSSSRSVKTDFANVDASQVLSKIKNLDVTEWRYKDKMGAKGRHIGPMAEDFYSLFELGPDDKHVAATDMASIALIAAKELQKKSDSASSEMSLLKAENASLKKQTVALESQLTAKNEALQKRLASLEKLVTNLASATDSLSVQGKQVALK